MKTIKEAMLAAVEFFEGNEEQWTKNTYARNAENLTVSPKSPDACKWCMLGRIAKQGNVDQFQLRDQLGYDVAFRIAELNDNMSRLAVMDYVRELASTKGEEP